VYQLAELCLLPVLCRFLAWLTSQLEDGGDMFSETSVDFPRTTRRYIPEDRTVHVSYYLKLKLNLCRHGFTKPESTVTSLVTYLDFITPLVGSQRQADAIYFDLSSAFDLVSHTLLLHKLSAFGLSGGCFNWFRSVFLE
jgi:hypothetical protein